MEMPRFRFTKLFAFGVLVTTALWAADLTLGTWQLNVKKSKLLPGPAFQSETRSYEEQGDGVKVTIRTVDGKGRQVTSVYIATPDGQQHAVSGSGGPADSVGLRRINEFTAESTLLRAGTRPVLRFERHLPETIDVVWRAVTDPIEMQAWFPTRIEIDEWRVGARLVHVVDAGRRNGRPGRVVLPRGRPKDHLHGEHPRRTRPP